MSKSILCAGTIRIQPIGKGRPRFARGKAYTPDATREWEDTVGFLARMEINKRWAWVDLPLEGALCIRATFNVKRPDSHFKKNGELKSSAFVRHTSKPDVDNMVKAFLDALQKRGIIQDDAAVDELILRKTWAKSPSIEFEISREFQSIDREE